MSLTLSVVIPVAPNETQHADLVTQLEQFAPVFAEHAIKLDIRLVSAGGRAKSLNRGALESSAVYIWFLHADSRISNENISALANALSADAPMEKSQDKIFYFNLSFREGGLARVNAFGANLRSILFRAPYGDQGLCMRRSVWQRLGGYPEDAPYAEDLLLVHAARKRQVILVRLASTLSSSARKYKSEGWLRLTLRYQQIFWKLTIRNRWKS